MSNIKEDLLAESLFDVFDEDSSGTLNFYEFMICKHFGIVRNELTCISLGKNAPCMDTPEAKLNWIFTAYDTDGGGRWASMILMEGGGGQV